MVTLKDIATEAGVSITTVSTVVHNRSSSVSPELVNRIRSIIEREHYVPSMTARTLVNDESYIIGVISHITPTNVGSTMSDPFQGSFVEGIEFRTREEGYFLMIRSVEDAQALESLRRSWKLSGVILTGVFADDFFEGVKNLGIPFVLIDSYLDDKDVFNIGLEDEKGGYIATRHLLENGHKVIAFASPTIREGGVVEKRLNGYKRALAEYSIPFDASLVFTQEIFIPEGKKLGHYLASKPEITGVFASADILAAGIMTGLREKGVLVPRDKSIIGFDDNYLCQLTNPGLTTIHQDAEQKGYLAVDMLLSQFRHETVEQKSIILPVSLVERESVRNLNRQ